MAPRNTDTAEAPLDVTIWEEQFGGLVQTDELMDPATIQRDIVLRILQADSFLDALDLADVGTLDARELADEHVSFVATEQPQWYRSGKFAEGTGFFVALPIRFTTGKDKGKDGVVTVGGANVLGQLRLGAMKGGIPLDQAMMFKKVATGSGNDVLWLKRGEESF